MERRRWIDSAQSASIGFLIGALLLTIGSSLKSTRLERDADADPMHWTLILGTDEWFDFTYQDLKALEAVETGVISTAIIHRPLHPDHEEGALGSKDVRLLGSNDSMTIEVECGRTAFLRSEEYDPATWKLCVQRDLGEWWNGKCKVLHSLQRITIQVDVPKCIFTWGRFPARKHEMRSDVTTLVEIVRTIEAPPSQLYADWILPLMTIGFLLTCAGIALMLQKMLCLSSEKEDALEKISLLD